MAKDKQTSPDAAVPDPGVAPVPALAANAALDPLPFPGPTQPSADTVAHDSIGNPKAPDDIRKIALANIPPDAKSLEQRKAEAVARDKALADQMQSTDQFDSTGKPKGQFAVKQMGFDKHGARIPDQVDYTKPLDVPTQVHGARGKGMPKDTFSG